MSIQFTLVLNTILILSTIVKTETIDSFSMKCQELHQISYEKCSLKKNCNMCNLSIFCGWCKKTKECLPIQGDTPICDEDCDEMVKLEHCYRLFTRKYYEEIDLVSPNKKKKFKIIRKVVSLRSHNLNLLTSKRNTIFFVTRNKPFLNQKASLNLV